MIARTILQSKKLGNVMNCSTFFYLKSILTDHALKMHQPLVMWTLTHNGEELSSVIFCVSGVLLPSEATLQCSSYPIQLSFNFPASFSNFRRFECNRLYSLMDTCFFIFVGFSHVSTAIFSSLLITLKGRTIFTSSVNNENYRLLSEFKIYH